MSYSYNSLNSSLTLNLSDESKEKITKRFTELESEIVTDELITEMCVDLLKGQIKSKITELWQSKEFREKLTNKISPIILQTMGDK